LLQSEHVLSRLWVPPDGLQVGQMQNSWNCAQLISRAPAPRRSYLSKSGRFTTSCGIPIRSRTSWMVLPPCILVLFRSRSGYSADSTTTDFLGARSSPSNPRRRFWSSWSTTVPVLGRGGSTGCLPVSGLSRFFAHQPSQLTELVV